MTDRALELVSAKGGINATAVYCWLLYYKNNETGLSFPSITTLAKNCKVSRRTVIRTIQLLEDIKLISIEHSQGSVNVYRLLDVSGAHPVKTTSIPTVTSDTRDTGVVTPGIRGVVTPGIHELDIIELDLLNKNTKECFDYFCLKTKKSLKLTPDRKALIKKRLSEGYTLEQLKKVVDNFVQDDWPERSNYIDLVYCIGVRNKVDNLERWLNYKHKVKQPGGSRGLSDQLLEARLGKGANKNMIKQFMRETPQESWWQINAFLRKRFPGSDDRYFAEAQRELIAEAREAKDTLGVLTAGIGRAA